MLYLQGTIGNEAVPRPSRREADGAAGSPLPAAGAAPTGEMDRRDAPALLRGPVRVAPEAEEQKAHALVQGGPAAAPSRPVRSIPAPEGTAPGAGEPLPEGLRGELEAEAGQPLDAIRVHRDAPSAALAEALGARAYAAGSHLVFGRGEWAPDSRAGRELIAHEVAHVRLPPAPGRIALQRKKGDVEPPLDIRVPQPASGETYQPAAKYPWQNPALRESIYPYREEMLSFFLQTYRELELLQDPSQALEPTAEEVRAERASVLKRQTAVNERLKDMLKRRVSKESMEWKQAQQEWLLLRDNLNYLPDPDAKKGGKDTTPTFTESQRIHWTAYRYARLGEGGKALTHDERLARVLDRFDADPDFKRYPAWLRYMVLHLSGMRYQSAHGSWAPAVALVSTLKRDEVRSSVARLSYGALAERTAKAATAVEAERSTLDEKKDRRRAATLKARAAAFAAVDPEIEKALGKPGTPDRDKYLELVRLGDARTNIEAKLETERDPKQYQLLLDLHLDLLTAEAEIEQQLGAKLKRVQATQDKARAALIEQELETALAALPKDEYGALWVLKTMRDKGSLPEFVWREIVRKTPLKHDQAGVDWETVTAAEKESRNRSDATTRRWVEIMTRWGRESTTAWREKHGADLSLVPIQAVCNEVAELSQHVRGVQSAGGIGQKAAWYATPGAATTFAMLDSNGQLKPGASLMFLEWSAAEPTDAVHIVRHDKGYPLRNEDKQTLADGFVDGKGWTYRFLADGRVSRSRAEVIGTSVDPKVPPPTRTVTEWMRWKHEAVVVEPDLAHGRILMFETGPIGLRLRTIKDTVGSWNVYVGFAPGGNAPADVKEFLKDILPKQQP